MPTNQRITLGVRVETLTLIDMFTHLIGRFRSSAQRTLLTITDSEVR